MAADPLQLVDAAVAAGSQRLAEYDSIDDAQVFAFDLAHLASAKYVSEATVAAYGPNSPLAEAFGSLLLRQAVSATWGNEALWGIDPSHFESAKPAHVASPPRVEAEDLLSDDLRLVAETFERFGRDQIAPHAEHVHRHDDDIPESVIEGIAGLGGFGMSIPTEYGGFAVEGDPYLPMVVATEALSRFSLGIGGSLLTRPEILAKALLDGGTEAQKQRWLPLIAGGDALAAIAVTEPDFGSDVASLSTTATKTEDGWRLNGTKTWCTFAGRAEVLMVLARTEPDVKGHRGLSAFVVEKPTDVGHSFAHAHPQGGVLTGTAIRTIGYRGMHSFEVNFDNYPVPPEDLIGQDGGRGQGFALQMAGFASGRLQTAARAVGLMQACLDEAQQYARNRKVFGQTLADTQLTNHKLSAMATTIAACRAATYDAARLMTTGEADLAAAKVKAFACRSAEWVAREAMQIHGGMGYAEEFPVSRYFVDARVLSIFEGAEEVLCLKVIAKHLVSSTR